MKNVVKLFSIGVMTVLLSFNTSLLFSQSKGKTIKKGSVFICNVAGPKQGAFAGTPVWVFANFNFIFEDGGKVFNSFETCMYTINTRNGGLGEAIVVKASDTKQDTYQVKDGNIYIWGSADTEQIAESAYLVLTIEDEEHLTPIKTTEEAFISSHFVYLGNMKEINKMSDEAKDQVERKALDLLLSLRNQETNIELLETKQHKEAERKKQEREQQEREQKQREKDSLLKQRTAQYSSCKFLFNTDIAFNYWITQTYSTMHDEIIRQIDKKMQKISSVVIVGTELSDNSDIKNDIVAICNICVNLKDDSSITDYVENKLNTFVSSRNYLANLFHKSNKSNYADFLLEYCNNR